MIPSLPISTLFPYTTLFRSTCMSDSSQGKNATLSALRFSKRILMEFWIPNSHGKKDRKKRDTCRKKRKDRKSTRLNSSHRCISYAVFCLKKKINKYKYQNEK